MPRLAGTGPAATSLGYQIGNIDPCRF